MLKNPFKSPEKSQFKRKIDRSAVCFVIFALAWAALSLVTSQFVVFFIMSGLLGHKLTAPLWVCIFYALTYLLTLVLVIYLPPWLYQALRQKPAQKSTPSTGKTNPENPFATNATELGLQHLPTFTDIGLAPIAYVISLVGINLLTAFMRIFPWFQADQAQETGFSYFITAGDRLFAILAIVIIAPVAEEIVMRGWLYGKLRHRLSVPVAILLVSLLFGLLHGQWNVGVSVFWLSIVLCGLREITGTIWSGILLHILSNGFAFYLLYIAGF